MPSEMSGHLSDDNCKRCGTPWDEHDARCDEIIDNREIRAENERLRRERDVALNDAKEYKEGWNKLARQFDELRQEFHDLIQTAKEWEARATKAEAECETLRAKIEDPLTPRR